MRVSAVVLWLLVAGITASISTGIQSSSQSDTVGRDLAMAEPFDDRGAGAVAGLSFSRMDPPQRSGRTMDPLREPDVEAQTAKPAPIVQDFVAAPDVTAAAPSDVVTEAEQQTATVVETAVDGPTEVTAATVQNVGVADPTGVDVGLPMQFPNDRISGHDIEGLSISYDDETDTLTVTINTYGIAGDADGDGDPGRTGPILSNLTGTDHPDFGGQESFAVMLDVDQDGVFDVIAGVSSSRDLSGYRVSLLSDPIFANFPSVDLAYGTDLPDHHGGTPASPSAASPDLTITITNFSTIDPADTSLDFGVNAFLGSLDDAGIGEDYMPGAGIPITIPLDARIGDHVWFDTNADGIQDGGEAPAPNVTVRLLAQDGSVSQTTTTDGSGAYEFIVRPGTHIVQFVPPATSIFSPAGAGGDAEADSNANPANGNSAAVTVVAGDRLTDIDAGLVEIDASVDIEKHTNGLDSDTAPGATLESGSTATFLYTVRNTGNVTLTNLQVTDDIEGAICTIPTLAVGGSDTCQATRTVTPGPYANEGNVVAIPVANGRALANVRDDDPSHHQGTIVTGIDLEKATNGEDADTAPGVSVEPGSTVTFTYVARNTGNVRLTNVRVVDDLEGTVCTIDEIAVDASESCTTTITAGYGPYRNVGSATGTPTIGLTELDDVSDTDPSHHVGVIRPDVTIEKATNGQDADAAPGPAIAPGETATFTYVVENSGNTPLTDLVVTDDLEGQICTIASLPIGASEQCTTSITVTEGQYTNIGTVVGTPVVNGGELDPVSDTDPSNHIGRVPGPVCRAGIRGPRMYAGGTTTWNTGYVAAAGSTVRVVTAEPGGSPDQPHEQVYVRVGDTLHGPTPAGLGELAFTTVEGGPIVVLHWSAISGDVSAPNSVEVALCGTDVIQPTPQCGASYVGPRMWHGSTTSWESGLTAAAGSMIRVTTTEPGNSPSQPNEQVYVQVGDTLYGPTPAGLGTLEFTVGAAGPVRVLHYSVVTGDTSMPNSVEFSICGSGLS